jgi:single-stranded DNA-binding protein
LYVEGDIVDEEYTNKEGATIRTKKVLASTVRFIGPKTEKVEEVSEEDASFWK